jgi:hypothetical protein
MIEPDPHEERKMVLLKNLVYPTINKDDGSFGPPPLPNNLTFEYSTRAENKFRLEFTNGTVIEAEIANVTVFNPRDL